MQFDHFLRDVDAAVRAAGTGAVAHGDAASWTSGERRVEVALLPPQNVSVELTRAGKPVGTTWYPIDPALVPVVARRIAGFLSASGGAEVA